MSVDHASESLGRVFHRLHLTDSCYCRTVLTSPWGLAIPESPHVVFHFLAEGECWVESDGERRQLKAGDLVVFPRGARHRLLGAPAVEPAWMLELPTPGDHAETAIHLSHGGGGKSSLVLCGGAAFDPPDEALIGLLPDLMSVSGNGGWVSSTLGLIEEEAVEQRPGGETVIARLCDVLVIHAIREWLSTSQDARDGWLGALRDPQMGTVLAEIDAAPEQPFTVARLAEMAHLSRASFAERFTRMVGIAPMEYVTRRRMQIATELMSERGLSPSEVAPRVGYGSAAAFSRAYKRTLGVSPGAARRARGTRG